MITIKAKLNFNINDQLNNGASLSTLFDGFPPTTITYQKPEGKKAFANTFAADQVLGVTVKPKYRKISDEEVRSA